MDDFPVDLGPGEKILRTEDGVVFLINLPLGAGYGVYYGTLWLTSERLIFKRTPYPSHWYLPDFSLSQPPEVVLSFPVGHIQRAYQFNASIATKENRTRRWFYAQAALALEFDNDGKEFFVPEDIAAWVKEIMAAVPSAPLLAYTNIPAKQHALIHGERAWWIGVAIWGLLVAVFGVCFFSCFFMFPILYAVLRSIGG